MAKKAKKKKADNDAEDGDENDEKNGAKKGGKGKLIIIIVVALLVILGGTGGGLYFMGYLDSLLGVESYEEEMSDEPVELAKPIYLDLPEFTADLKTGSCRAPFMKLSLTIQIDENDKALVLERQPKIIDRFHQHLRSKERQELSGKDGAELLRTEMTLILNATIKPAKVLNVLFKSMVVQ